LSAAEADDADDVVRGVEPIIACLPLAFGQNSPLASDGYDASVAVGNVCLDPAYRGLKTMANLDGPNSAYGARIWRRQD
jgi:hypothetical protein